MKSNKFTIAKISQSNDLSTQTLAISMNLGDGVGTPIDTKDAVSWKLKLLDNTDKLKAIPTGTNVKEVYNFNNKLYTYTDKRLYEAADANSDFALVSSGTLTAATNITAIASNKNYLYIGTNAGKVYKMNKTTSTFTEVNYLSGATGTKINNIYLGQDSSSINSVAIATQGNGIFITNNVNPTQASDFQTDSTGYSNVYSIASKGLNQFAIGTDNGVYNLTYTINNIVSIQDPKIASRKVKYISYAKSKDQSSENLYIYSQKDVNGKYNIYISPSDSSSSSSAEKLTIRGGAAGLGSEITDWNFNSIQNGLIIVTANGEVYQASIEHKVVMKDPSGNMGLPSGEKIKSVSYLIKSTGNPSNPYTIFGYILTQSNKFYLG